MALHYKIEKEVKCNAICPINYNELIANEIYGALLIIFLSDILP